ncbi:MAG: cation transporter [Gammaproteobacteria bacterium]|uniref:Cation transporter n=1 Tax=Candidatus Thiopontia autotrophica TaxID=2841688 RepID=A0A8J6PAT5_9GAMM|nr:cation transporter [Candidatus Thiopontia autotrophica]MBL6968992.1 cation transporter [Gammaproteobacteria bacterium]
MHNLNPSYPQARRATLIGGVINLLLSIIKMVIGIIGNSQALVADGVHSLSDLISDVMVLYATKHGGKDADDNHPYGHGRIETIITVAVGILLIAVAIGISADAIDRLFHPEQLSSPGIIVLFAALVSILAKEGLYHYTLRVATQIRSNLLRANAWHHRSDALSSIVVLVGVMGTMSGLEYLDAIAAIGVSLMVAKAGVELSRESIEELIDTGLKQEEIDTIKQTIQGVEGVRAMHRLRTRKMGANAIIDVHILVDPKLSVSEGHHIADRVESKLYEQIEDISDVTIHIDPENDEEVTPCRALSMRSELMERMEGCWKDVPESRLIKDVTLHYLNGELELEVWIPLGTIESMARAQQLSETLNNCIVDDPEVKQVRAVYF